MRRVVRPHGLVIAAVFGSAPNGASKDAVDQVARDFGFEPPAWYIGLKVSHEPLSNTPALLEACAESAGLEDIEVADVIADSGLDTPESITAYRSGLAHIAPFVDSLSPARQTEFFECAVAAVRERGQPVRPRVLILSSRVPHSPGTARALVRRAKPQAGRGAPTQARNRGRSRATRRAPPSPTTLRRRPRRQRCAERGQRGRGRLFSAESRARLQAQHLAELHIARSVSIARPR